MNQKIICPVCKGSGWLHEPKSTRRSKRNVLAAKLLHNAGFSHREIMPLLGYKSSRSVAMLLEKAKKP